jgi:hypothetical protein
MQLLRRDVMAGNRWNCYENIYIAEFYNLSYVKNGQIKVFLWQCIAEVLGICL